VPREGERKSDKDIHTEKDRERETEGEIESETERHTESQPKRETDRERLFFKVSINAQTDKFVAVIAVSNELRPKF